MMASSKDRSSRGLACVGLLLLIGVPAWNARAAEPPAQARQDGGQVTEGFINLPVGEVWKMFTTSEGYKATGVAKAEVNLRLGGEIRSHYDSKGRLGDPETIVNEILAYEPERMLAMRIKQAPASFPYRGAIEGTWTVLYLTPAGENMTHVRIVGLGYDQRPESQAMRKFFADGNRRTLDQMAKPYWPKCAKCEADAQAQAAQ
jgi:uncharacterized protein YndB with AHSA1/START domain